MRINLQLQTSDFVDVNLACDHCHGSSCWNDGTSLVYTLHFVMKHPKSSHIDMLCIILQGAILHITNGDG